MYLTFICAKTVENIIISFHYGPNNILISMVRRIISIIDFDDQGHRMSVAKWHKSDLRLVKSF